MTLKVTSKGVYTLAEIMEDNHHELWEQGQRQVDRLVELQGKMLERFEDFRESVISLETYIYFRCVFTFAQELWNVLESRCTNLAKASNGDDNVDEDDAIFELKHVLSLLDDMPMQDLDDDSLGIHSLYILRSLYNPQVIIVFPPGWNIPDIAGAFSTHGEYPEDLLEIASADDIPEAVTIGKLLDDDTMVRIY